MSADLHRANRVGGVVSLIALALCILIFILIELYLDYISNIDFRNIKWMTILYAMFFFAGTGGLIGIASRAGKRWGTVAIVPFLVMTFLAFWQRAKTGM